MDAVTTDGRLLVQFVYFNKRFQQRPNTCTKHLLHTSNRRECSLKNPFCNKNDLVLAKIRSPILIMAISLDCVCKARLYRQRNLTHKLHADRRPNVIQLEKSILISKVDRVALLDDYEKDRVIQSIPSIPVVQARPEQLIDAQLPLPLLQFNFVKRSPQYQPSRITRTTREHHDHDWQTITDGPSVVLKSERKM